MNDVQPSGPHEDPSDQRSQQLEVLAPNQRTEQELLIRHPLFSSPSIATEPTIQAYLEFKEQFLGGASGFTLLGERGSGRKTALLVMRDLLRLEFPELTTVTCVLSEDEPKTPYDRWASLLFAAGHRFRGGNQVDAKRRLLNLIDERTAIAGVYRFVLFVQRVERLDRAMMLTLLDLKENLQIKGIQFVVVGSAEINAFKAMIDNNHSPEQLYIIRSLLGSGHVLRPLTSVLDLRSILSAIDNMPYLEAGSVTWGQYFLPKAYQAGFRLSAHADSLKLAIDEYAANGRVTSTFIFRTIQHLLTQAAKVDQPGLTIGAEEWKRAMGYIADAGITYLPAPKEG